MPTTDAEEEILFHRPTNTLKQTPDSADPKKNLVPPSRRVVRPSAEGTSDVIRHAPAPQPLPKSTAVPEAVQPQESVESRVEFAAAAARARAAVAQQQQNQQQAPPAQRSKLPPRRNTGQAPLAAPTPPESQPKQQAEAEVPAALATAAAETPAPVQKTAEPQPELQAQAPLPQQPPEPVAEQQPAPVRQPRAQVESEPAPQPRQKRESGKNFLLHTHGLKKVYDGRAVVDGVEVTVRPSEIVGLLGPNGAGKTTSFYMIVGLVQPNGGTVTFNGKDATNEPMYRRARLGMGYLPQEESIFRKLSVEDNILAVMETQNVPRSERRDRAQELMRRFGIERLAKNEAITLSGGEKRRLTIARSLVTSPKLLMLDEPFSGVDPIAVGEIQEIVLKLREQGLAILITDHNVRETLGIVDRAYLLFEGQVKREGTREFLINDPLSKKLYLGEQFSM